MWTVGILSSSFIGGVGLYYLKSNETKSDFLNTVRCGQARPISLPNNNTRSAVYRGLCSVVQAHEGKRGKGRRFLILGCYPLLL